MQGKILTALLLERLLLEAQIFSPGDTTCETMSRWRLVLEARDTLRAALVPALSIGHWLRRGRAIARALRFCDLAGPCNFPEPPILLWQLG